MSTRDRFAPGYEPGFDADYEWGHQAELWLADVIDGLQSDRTEVKRDGWAQETGNLYIEQTCNGKPSGLTTTTAEWWVYVLGDPPVVALVAPTDLWRRVAMAGHPVDMSKRVRPGSHPTTGVIVKVYQAILQMLAHLKSKAA